MAEAQELAVIRRTYDLVKWSCGHTCRFPRSHRFVLGERIERRLYDLLETLIQARYTRDRQALLRQANLSLEVLRFQMRNGSLVAAVTSRRRARSGAASREVLPKLLGNRRANLGVVGEGPQDEAEELLHLRVEQGFAVGAVGSGGAGGSGPAGGAGGRLAAGLLFSLTVLRDGLAHHCKEPGSEGYSCSASGDWMCSTCR
jgi:hypothetical protein